VDKKYCCGAVNHLLKTCRKRPFSKHINSDSTAACSLFEMPCAGVYTWAYGGTQVNMVNQRRHTVPDEKQSFLMLESHCRPS